MESDFKIAFQKLYVCVGLFTCGFSLSEDDKIWANRLKRKCESFIVEYNKNS